MMYTLRELESIEFNDVTLRDLFNFAHPILSYQTGEQRHPKRLLSLQPILDLAINRLMNTAKSTGKKLRNYILLSRTFELLRQRGHNPLTIFVRAIEQCAPREGIAKFLSKGRSVMKAVDLSPSLRIDKACDFIFGNLRKYTRKNNHPQEQILMNELLSCSQGSSSSYAIVKRDELERMAKGVR